MSTFFWLLVKLFDKRMASIFRTPGGKYTEDIENGCILNFSFFVEHGKATFCFYKTIIYFPFIAFRHLKIKIFTKYIIYIYIH